MTDVPLEATISQKAVLFGPEDDVLLLLQEQGPWELPGGRIGPEESVEAGLAREVYEETGLRVVVERPVHTDAWHNETGQGRFVVVYRCRTDEREIRLSEEHVHWRWVPPEAAVEFQLEKDAFRTALERAIDDPTRDGRVPRARTSGRDWMPKESRATEEDE